MGKKLATGTGVAVLALGLAAAGFRAYMGSRFSAAGLEQELESRYRCQVSLGEVDLALFRRSPRLVVSGVQIAPLGAAPAAAAAETPPPPLPATGLRAREVELTATFRSLLAGEIEVVDVILRDVVAETVVSAKGVSSLNLLFDERDGDDVGRADPAPGVERGAGAAPGRAGNAVVFVAAPSADSPADKDAAGGTGGGDQDDLEPGGFHASSIDLPRSLRRVHIENGTVVAYLSKPKAYLTLAQIDTEAREIAFDPDDLARRNRAVVDFHARLTVDGADRSVRFADFGLAMDADLAPFDPATGFLNPGQVYPLVLGKGSSIEALPMLEQLSGSLATLERAGVKLERLKLRADLATDSPLHLRLGNRKVELAGDSVLPFSDYTLTLDSESWLRPSDSTHAFAGNLLASEALSREALDSLQAVVSEQVGSVAGESLGERVASLAREILVEPLLDDGKVSLDFRSSGKISDPKVKVENKLRDLKDAAKDALKRGALGDLLNGLLGR
jgi:hypothetical protein